MYPNHNHTTFVGHNETVFIICLFVRVFFSERLARSLMMNLSYSIFHMFCQRAQPRQPSEGRMNIWLRRGISEVVMPFVTSPRAVAF